MNQRATGNETTMLVASTGPLRARRCSQNIGKLAFSVRLFEDLFNLRVTNQRPRRRRSWPILP